MALLGYWVKGFGGRSLIYSLMSVFIVGVKSFPWTFFDKDKGIPKILSSFQRQSPDRNHRQYGEIQVAGGHPLKGPCQEEKPILGKKKLFS